MTERPASYRLIWFQHFHKAAGTTIVSLARNNGEVLYPKNLNGSPLDDDGNYIPIWAYEARRLGQFLDHCQDIGCTFLAPEWGVGDLAALEQDPRVITVTAIREPFERFVSNFLFDFRLGYTDKRNIEEYVGSKRSFSRFNYYTRMLARLAEETETITNDDYARARSMLDKFDCVEVVGSGNWIENLCGAVGWSPQHSHENRRKDPQILALQQLLRGRPRTAWRIYQSGRLRVDDQFQSRFMIENRMDYEIFAHSQRRKAI